MRTTTRRCCGSAWRSVGLMWWCAPTASMRWCRWRCCATAMGCHSLCAVREQALRPVCAARGRGGDADAPSALRTRHRSGHRRRHGGVRLSAQGPEPRSGGRGAQLRLMPSTWRSATIGGFIAGAPVASGLVRWGFLRDPGHLLGLEVVTLEPEPRVLQLEASVAASVEPCLRHQRHHHGSDAGHGSEYCLAGTGGGLPRLVFGCELAPLLCCGHRPALVHRAGSAWSSCPNGICPCQRRTVCCLVSPDAVSTVHRLATAVGAAVTHLGSEADRHAMV